MVKFFLRRSNTDARGTDLLLLENFTTSGVGVFLCTESDQNLHGTLVRKIPSSRSFPILKVHNRPCWVSNTVEYSLTTESRSLLHKNTKETPFKEFSTFLKFTLDLVGYRARWSTIWPLSHAIRNIRALKIRHSQNFLLSENSHQIWLGTEQGRRVLSMTTDPRSALHKSTKDPPLTEVYPFWKFTPVLVGR